MDTSRRTDVARLPPAWLATPDLVRTFVAIVDKIAIGASPAKNAAFARPKQPFQVTGSGPSLPR